MESHPNFTKALEAAYWEAIETRLLRSMTDELPRARSARHFLE